VGLKSQIQPGVNFTPAYQMSGTPYCITIDTVSHTTAIAVNFPFVTRWVVISARDDAAGAVRVGFSENGVNTNPIANYFLLELASDGTGAAGSRFNVLSPRLELRCKTLWIRGDAAALDKVSIIAGLTGIDEGAFPTLSGSDGFSGIG
jgi:hypothetical protein